MEIKRLSCPVCLKPHFKGVDALRSTLIIVATSQISCPVCNDLLMGLDKLTIHLFSHITNTIEPTNLAKTSNQDNSLTSSTGTSEKVIETKAEIEHRQNETGIIHNTVKEYEVCSKNRILDIGNNFGVVRPQALEIKTISAANIEKSRIKCDICNFSFSDETILEIHQKLLHHTRADKTTGIYSYHCHLCSKKFKMKGSLMVHLRVAHYGFGQLNVFRTNFQAESNFKQQNYNYGNIDEKSHDSNEDISNNFNKYKSLKIQDNKQWACDVCSKLFTTKYFLKKHKRLHTGEMPYFCTQCNKSFTFQQSYHKHMLYHSSEKPHVCNECGRAFKELSTLHNHERIHSGERPFACETCGKCFRQRVSYLVHRRIHTGAMPYKCTACDKTFRYKVSQKSHKCPANPPGLVVRTPDLIEKLMRKGITNMEIVDDFSKHVGNNKIVTSSVATDNMTNDALECQINMASYENNTDNEDHYKIEKNVMKKQNTLHKRYEQYNNTNKICDRNEALPENYNNIHGTPKVANVALFYDDIKIPNSETQIITQSFMYDEQNNTFAKCNTEETTNDGNCNFNDRANNNKDTICKRSNEETFELNINVLTENADKNLNKPTQSCNTVSPDFFSMILSPILPEEQIVSETNVFNAENITKRTLETINEESFRRLLYGPSE